MEKNLRQTIKDIIKNHLLKKGGKVFGQCLTAVGWVGGTLPELYEKDGMKFTKLENKICVNYFYYLLLA